MKQHSPEQLKALKDAAWSMYQAFMTFESPAEIRQFLLDLCTPAELEAMVDRWWVANLLTEGLSYREISDLTGVSVTTVGRVARFIAQGEGGYQIALERTNKEKS
jgi:TrpR-related protein YerC/YecD